MLKSARLHLLSFAVLNPCLSVSSFHPMFVFFCFLYNLWIAHTAGCKKKQRGLRAPRLGFISYLQFASKPGVCHCFVLFILIGNLLSMKFIKYHTLGTPGDCKEFSYIFISVYLVDYGLKRSQIEKKNCKLYVEKITFFVVPLYIYIYIYILKTNYKIKTDVSLLAVSSLSDHPSI